MFHGIGPAETLFLLVMLCVVALPIALAAGAIYLIVRLFFPKK